MKTVQNLREFQHILSVSCRVSKMEREREFSLIVIGYPLGPYAVLATLARRYKHWE